MHEGVYHLSVKMIQRSKGRSATAAIAYRAGIDITDQRTGLRFDYSRKSGVTLSEAFLPLDAPPEMKSRTALWNAIEQAETRKNSSVAREFEGALPADLPPEARKQIARDFARYIVNRFGVAADLNLHSPHPRNDDEGSTKNYHFHLLTSTRILTADGFTDKVRDLDSAKTGSAIVDELREHFARLVNEAYAKHGVSMFVDHRSFERRRIDATPTIHIGVNHGGERAAQNIAIKVANSHLAALARESAAIQKQIDDLLYAQAPEGETIPLFAFEPAPEPEPTMKLQEPEPVFPWKQLPLDFDTAPVIEITRNEPEAPAPALAPEPALYILNMEKHRRYRELCDLRDKSCRYGKAHAALIDQRTNAASFQNELDNKLEKPNLFHRFVNSKKWQKYERDRDDLKHRINNANARAAALRKIVKDNREYADQWDRGGWYEHKSLAKELGYGEEAAAPDLPAPPQLLPTFDVEVPLCLIFNAGNCDLV